MTTVDQLLLQIVDSTQPTIEEMIPKRDARVLRSFSTMLRTGTFLTENQSKLLLKILRENKQKMPIFEKELNSSLSSPMWSKMFQYVEVIKKMFIGTSQEGVPSLVIEFSYSAAIRKIMVILAKDVTGLEQSVPGKIFRAELTESNIVRLVENLSPLDFVIDEKILDHYKTIKSWSENEIFKQFELTSMTNTNFQRHITDDLGINTPITQAIINDRSLRYQYIPEKSEKNPENLTEIIAFRKNTKIWVDRKEYGLDQVIEALTNLRRLPVLVIFDTYDEKRCFAELQNLTENLEKNGIFNKVGIYFRLNNSETGKEFNQFIADKSFNKPLDINSRVVGIQSGKIPKFLLKNEWKPMSVISLGNSLRNSKSSVYTNCCDLVIAYSDTQPISIAVDL